MEIHILVRNKTASRSLTEGGVEIVLTQDCVALYWPDTHMISRHEAAGWSKLTPCGIKGYLQMK